jgi:tetratricopeptide (TPR) repeat protein
MDNLSVEKQTLRILFLASEPTDAGKLRLGAELEAVRSELAKNPAFEIKDKHAVKPEDVLKTILTYKPHIVHFSGHGQESGEICFEDDKGLSKAIDPLPLANLFKLATEYVKCVVVNTCYSEKQVKAISEYVPIVIGTKKEISDNAAIRFSTAFYAALEPDLSPKSLRRAFEFGRTNIWLDNLPEHLTPLLIEGSPEVRFASEVDNAFLSVTKPSGIVFDALKRGLSLTGQKMGVPEDVVSKILNEKISKLVTHNSGVMEYENTLKQILEDEYPLSDTSKLALLQLQYGLGLTEDEVKPIHDRILNDSNISSAENWYDRGRKQTLLNNVEKAIEFYSKALEKDDDYSGAYYERGYCQDVLKNYVAGIQDFTKSIERNKKWELASKSLAYYSRARCYHAVQTDDENERNKYLQRSLDDWNMTLELDRNQSEAYYGRGLVYAAMNDLAKAVVDYKKAYELSTLDERKKTFARALATSYLKLGNMDDYSRWTEHSKEETSKLAGVDK